MPEPIQQFRGAFARAELFELVAKGIVTDAQAWLALTVDSYVNSRGEGCWATNQTLARKTGKKVRQIQYNLKELQRLGLVIHCGSKIINGKPFRLLETKWSRLDMSTETTELSVNKKTDAVECTPVNKKTDAVECTPVNKKTDAVECTQRIRINEFKNENHIVRSEAERTGRNPLDLANELAQQLREAILRKAPEHIKLPKLRMARWTEGFTKCLALDSEEEVRSVLMDHIENLNGPYQPEAWSGWSFYQKYDKLKKAKDRRKQPPQRTERVYDHSEEVYAADGTFGWKRIYRDVPLNGNGYKP